MFSTSHTTTGSLDHDAFEHRLDQIGWGLFLVMIGGLALVPDRWVPDAMWLVGAGVIMLGQNAVRYARGVALNGFTIVLGFIALSSGLSDVAGVDLPILPIILVVIGLNILFKIGVGRNPLGTPER